MEKKHILRKLLFLGKIQISRILNSSTWTQSNFTDPVFDNVADLRFAISFTNALGPAANGVGFAMDEFKITATGPCAIDLGPDLSLCENDSISYDFSILSNTNFIWSDGSTDSQNSFSQAGTYWLEVTDSVFGCTVSDTVVITENPQIIIDSVITIKLHHVERLMELFRFLLQVELHPTITQLMAELILLQLIISAVC